MKGHEIWRRELFDEIRSIADEDELRRLWSGMSSHAISSFAEEVAHVFDDYDIDGFIECGSAQAKLHLDQFDALRRCRDLFAIYIESVAPASVTSINYEKVLADPQWRSVAEAARAFIFLLDARPV
jgi:hypothetical protein